MICVPIVSINNLKEDLKITSRHAGLYEIRLDLIKKCDLAELKSQIKKPIIVTNRRAGEGGKAKDSKERIESLKDAVEIGADYVDIELSSGSKSIDQIKSAIMDNKDKTKLIVSYHNLKETPSNLIRIYNDIKQFKPEIIKIATFANSIQDNIQIFDLVKLAKKEKQKIVALCMGEDGKISRIISHLLGAEFTFASIAHGKESAPGQFTLQELVKIYRLNKLKNPKIFGLVGNPVSHSKGYLIHNRAFGKQKINSIYLNFRVDELKEFVEGFRNILDGFSVTIPFKTDIIKYIDRCDLTAKEIGAVNTVIKKNNMLVGYNTDAYGAVGAIKTKTQIKDNRVVIIGAGGVAKAIAYGITLEGGKLILANRTIEKSKKLAKSLNCSYISQEELGKLCDVQILINATSIGMNENKSPVDKAAMKKIMKKGGIVFDSVYTPVNTNLLKYAKSLNLKTVSGEKMFLLQAKEQFRLFTGKEMMI